MSAYEEIIEKLAETNENADVLARIELMGSILEAVLQWSDFNLNTEQQLDLLKYINRQVTSPTKFHLPRMIDTSTDGRCIHGMSLLRVCSYCNNRVPF